MVKSITNNIFFAVFIIVTTSCSNLLAPSASPIGQPRTIIISGDSISEDIVNGFTTWYCTDYLDAGPTLVEVGYFNNSPVSSLGFILYDGGYLGEGTVYSRTGLEHRWDWGLDGNYSFIINTDGKGLYYDFSMTLEGESAKPRNIYQCHKRE